MNKAYTLIKKYFEANNLVSSNIQSFNDFIDYGLQEIVDENKEITPTIIPPDVEDYKIKIEKIWVEKPIVIEADGSKRKLYPHEARLRKLTYSAPIFIEASAYINNVQRESVVIQIGSLPIMVRSKYCHLNGLSREELIKLGEDPDDPGGYFIINGSERVIVTIEDLAPNHFLVEEEKTGPSKFVGKIFSERGSYKIPHTLEKLRDGIYYLTFTRIKRIPLIIIIKALGLTKDEEIMNAISPSGMLEEFIPNMYKFSNIKTETEAIEYIAKKALSSLPKELRTERMNEIIDRFLLPHIGIEKKDRLAKAINLCKMLKKFILVERGQIKPDDKDHYMNKKLKLSGDLLADLFRFNIKILINDMLYNFQRIVKRGKFPSMRLIIREKLLTQRIYSALATGNWTAGRKGISQRVQRVNFLEMLSHLQRVVSPLSTQQENFEARELHATHLGRLCPIETPEGTNIGLRKNFALLCKVSSRINEDEVLKTLKEIGLKT